MRESLEHDQRMTKRKSVLQQRNGEQLDTINTGRGQQQSQDSILSNRWGSQTISNTESGDSEEDKNSQMTLYNHMDHLEKNEFTIEANAPSATLRDPVIAYIPGNSQLKAIP